MRWIAFALLVGVGVAAQTQPKKKAAPARRAPPAATPREWPIQSLSVAGNRNYKTEQILAIAGLKAGQPASTGVFEAARERILATGYFATVGFRYEPSHPSVPGRHSAHTQHQVLLESESSQLR